MTTASPTRTGKEPERLALNITSSAPSPTSGDAFCRRTTINQPEVIELVRAESDYEKTLVVSRAAPSQEKKIELF